MPIVKVPLISPVYRNIDGSQARDENFILMNGYSDEKGATYSMPGYSEVIAAPTGARMSVNGLYHWIYSNKGDPEVLVAIIDDTLYKFEYSGGTYTRTALSTAGLLYRSSNVPYYSFCSDGQYLFVAGGGRIHYSSGSDGDTAELGDGDAPSSVTHIAYLDGYILANDSDNKVYFSNVNNSLSWSALDFFSAVGKPDPITALFVWNRELYLFGPRSIEVWENDGSTPFKRIPGGYIEVGTIAPYSIAQTDGGFFFLGEDRRFVEFNGRAVQQISTAYDKVIESLDTVSDCRALRIKISGRQFILFQFPTANRSFLYDYIKKEWSELGEYLGLGEQYNMFNISSYVYVPAWGKHFVGGKSAPCIFELSSNNYQYNTSDIRVRRVSGHISYGTNQLKQCNGMTLRLKRGFVADSSEPKMSLRYNDDNKGWSNEIEISLGKMGDYEIVKEIYPFGTYTTRQYEMIFSGGVEFVVGDVEEDIEVLM